MKKYVIGFILGAIIFSGISVFATLAITADQIEYSPNVSVKDKIDDLYTKVKPVYTGDTTITPTKLPQTLYTSGKNLTSNILINPIPSKYKELNSLTNELTASDLLSGKKAYNSDGEVVTGSISTYSGSTTVTPTSSQQSLSTSGKYMSSNITINAIPSEYKDISDSTVTNTSDIVSGKVAYTSNGTKLTGTAANCISSTYHHGANSQINIAFDFNPSRFYGNIIYNSSGYFIEYYSSLNSNVRMYDTQRLVDSSQYMHCENNSIYSDFPTSFGWYTLEFNINYIACR